MKNIKTLYNLLIADIVIVFLGVSPDTLLFLGLAQTALILAITYHVHKDSEAAELKFSNWFLLSAIATALLALNVEIIGLLLLIGVVLMGVKLYTK